MRTNGTYSFKYCSKATFSDAWGLKNLSIATRAFGNRKCHPHTIEERNNLCKLHILAKIRIKIHAVPENFRVDYSIAAHSCLTSLQDAYLFV